MKMPKVIRSKFEIGMDEPINTAVLRAAFEFVGIVYDKYGDVFHGRMPWGVAIDDSHDEGDDEPHYSLEFGCGNYTDCQCKSYRVRYCDYHSTAPEEDKEATYIATDPGQWIIRIWVPEQTFDPWVPERVLDPKKFAKAINDAYNGAMIENLKDYMILTSGDPEELIDQQDPG